MFIPDADLRQHDCRYQNVSLTKVRVSSSFPAKDADADLRQHNCWVGMFISDADLRQHDC